MYKYSKFIFKLILFALVIGGLYLSSLYDYLLFHSIAEIFSIVIGFSLFMIAWNSRGLSTQKFDYLVYIGVAYFFISIIDLLHTLSYKGLYIFKDYDYYASQFWIAARYLESVSLLLPFIFLKYQKTLKLYFTFSIYSLVTAVIISSIVYYKTFPICFIEGIGQTAFKIASEYVICVVLFIAAILMRKNKSNFDNQVYKYLCWSIGATIISEYAFTLYVNVYDFSNLVGHYFKILSFYLIYKAIIIKGITEPYERACNELKERKKLLRMYKNLFNSIDESLCIIDVIYNSQGNPIDYRYVETNPTFEQEVGLQNVEGKLVSEVIPTFDQKILKTLSRVVLNGEAIRSVYEIKSLKNWYSSYAFRIDQENHSRVAILFRNITEEIKEKNEMEKYIKMQNEIFANVSHELKTPLTIIYTTIQLLEIYIKKESLDAVRNKISRSIDIIKQNSFRFTRLINNVVDLSKMDSEVIELNLKNEDIAGFMKNTVIYVSEFMEDKNINIIFNSDIEEKVIAFDSDRVERVLLNLISNAIKFSNNQDTIFVELADKEEFVEISVRDTGVGIDKKHLKYIFERYYQVDKTLSRNREGTGIGLSLVKSIIEMHGGKVWVESRLGIGSIFRVSLPTKTIELPTINEQKNKCDRIEMISVEFSDIYN